MDNTIIIENNHEIAELDNERLHRIAEEIKHISDPWDIDYQDTDEIAKNIEDDPLATIEHLLNMLQDYIAG